MREYIKNYRKLLNFLADYKGVFFGASFLMLMSAIFGGLSLGMVVPLADKVLTDKKIILPHRFPEFIEDFIDKINSTPPYTLLKIVSVWIVVLFFLKGLLMFFQNYLMNELGLRVVKDIRQKLFEKIQSLSLDFFEKQKSGELAGRIISDTGLVQHALSYGLADLVYQGFQVIVFGFVVFFINWKLALFSMVIFPLVIGPVTRIARKIKKFTIKSQENIGGINNIIFENISSQRVIKGFNLEDLEIKKFKDTNYNVYKFQRKMVKRTLITSPLTEFLGATMAMILFFIGGKEVIEGKLSFGVFGLFLGSLLSMIRPLKKLSQVHSINQKAFGACERIYQILEQPSTIKDKPSCISIKEFKDEIIFEDVYFKYKEGDWVLRGINLKVKKGEKIAIVAQSGEGKTTLVNLIPRFYDPQKGRILIDGKDLRDICLKSLRDLIGIVTQEPILFNTTVKENISYGKKEASFTQIKQACKMAFAEEFIKNLPQGYETIIGERGFKLSGGEKQRLCIARALLKNPQILILDEATSQLDSESERIVQQALERLMENRTVFVIAHRLSTIKNVDRIIVLQNGKIVEEGTHQYLIANSRLYKYLYQLQYS